METGDLNQVAIIRGMYDHLLGAKFAILDNAPTHYLSAEEVAELEIRLAKITAELKRIDSIRTFIVTGKKLEIEEPILSLPYYTETKLIGKLKSRIQDLRHANTQLIAQLNSQLDRKAWRELWENSFEK